MKRQISKKQYIFIDMILMTLILCALEWASSAALNAFSKELYTISIVLPVALIAMMRHGALGVLLGFIGGLAYCMVNGAAWDVFVIYMLGNCFIVINLIWFKNPGKESIRQSTGLIILYVISGYLLMNLGRSMFAFIFGYRPFLATMLRYYTTDALSAIMSVIIILIASRQNGVFEDQMHYLERLAAEEEQRDGRKA